MKKPTSNGVDMYQIGNDYPQAPISAYFVASSYADGIYTQLNKDNLFSAKSVDGFDDSFFDLKSASGLNKRILNVPQSDFTVNAEDVVPSGALSAVSGDKYFADEYATANFIDRPVEE
jgi:hypothetical protein